MSRAKRFRKRLKRFRRYTGYYLLRAAYAPLRFLPRAVLLMVGAVAAQCVFVLDRRDREQMRRNLAEAFPEKSRRRRERIARRVFPNLARGAVDVLVAYRQRRKPAEEVVPMEVDWVSYARVALKRGAVVVSGHVGAWELFACAAARYAQGKLGIVARRLYLPPLNRWIVGIRRSFGMKVFYQRESALKLVRFLKKGNVIGVLPDQDTKRVAGTFVPFFGKPAWTPTGPAALALAAGVPLIVTYLVWAGGRWRLASEGPLALPQTGSRQADIEELTEAWTQVLERVIRRYPDQWVWFHRRWRRRPP